MLGHATPAPTPDSVPFMTDEQAWATIGAPLLVGLALWIAAELVRAYLAKVSERRTRRRRIVSLMGRARAVAFRAIRDGHFDTAYVLQSDAPTEDARAQYDDLTAEALALFERDELAVAYWTAAEFYAGWLDPFASLMERETPREHPERGRLLNLGEMDDPWKLARPEELIRWADARWPRARGDRGGPRFGEAYTPGDIARHRVVHPNSDVNTDMLLSWVNYLPGTGGAFAEPGKRELRRLRAKYPEHAKKYPPAQLIG